MDIGIKLDIGFSENEAHRRLFGRRDVLEFLRDLGVRAVETAVETGTDFEALADHARLCSEAGFHVSIHPYTELTPCNPAYFTRHDGRCRRFHARVISAAAGAAEYRDRDVIVNIHGAAARREENRRALVDESIRFFAWAREWSRENAPRVKTVVELQFRPFPDESLQRIGDDYPELVEITGRSGIDACWDLGHAYMNAKRFGLSLEPPPGLVKRIAHVHCHDVSELDHHPLVFDRVPWERLLTLAAERGFGGTVILEVPPENFLKAGGLGALVGSIEKLTAFAGQRPRTRAAVEHPREKDSRSDPSQRPETGC